MFPMRQIENDYNLSAKLKTGMQCLTIGIMTL